jgi:Wiskott-Aldrich syndrome protein
MTTTTTATITPTSTPTSSTSPIAPTRHDIILLIRWRHHGERRALEQTSHMTVRGIQQAALAFVRRQAASFVNVPPAEGRTLPAYRMLMAGLMAAVKAVVVDGVAYDLSGYAGEDLSRFVASLASSSGSGTSPSGTGAKVGGVPLFEVEVWNMGVGGNGNGEGVVSVGVPVRSGPGSGGVSDGGVNSQVVVNGVSVGPRMVFPSPPGMPPN